MFSSISFSVFLFLQNETTTTTTMIIQMDRLLANGHPIGPASCKWSSGWTSLLQMIIGMDRPLVNDHLDGPASCKWSSGWTGLLQMIRIQIWDLHCLLDQVFSLFLGKVNGASPYTHFTLFFLLIFCSPFTSQILCPPQKCRFISFSSHSVLQLCSNGIKKKKWLAQVAITKHKKRRHNVGCNHQGQEVET